MTTTMCSISGIRSVPAARLRSGRRPAMRGTLVVLVGGVVVDDVRTGRVVPRELLEEQPSSATERGRRRDRRQEVPARHPTPLTHSPHVRGRHATALSIASGRMRLLVVSDLHYTLKQLDWVISVAGEYDLVVMAGDHLDISSFVEPDAQIAVVLEYLSRIAAKTAVVACSGNHDLNARNEHDELAAQWLESARRSNVCVDGDHFETEQVLVTVCPWWDGPRTREAVGRQLADDAALVGDRQWIWVYHAPPTRHPRAGPASGTTATPISWAGSGNTSPASSCAGTYTSRRSRPTAGG